ncbi:MAG: hypothetical protein ACWA5R_05040 [bacterium]
MSELVSQDKLRLNVLLRQDLKALRIDEGRMMVHGLTSQGEKKLQLNPDQRPEKYLRLVRRLISSYVLDSPEGYPRFISRWTRMRNTQSELGDTLDLDKLLLSGEPEAVIAVVFSPHLTAELAEYAWWCQPDSLSARQMLINPNVANSEFAKTLAAHLLEFLPFEEDQSAISQSVQLILQPGLISEEERLKLWKRSQRRNPFLAGFVLAGPDAIPEQKPETNQPDTVIEVLDTEQNQLLQLCKSQKGKAFLNAASKAFDKITDQNITVMLFNQLGYFARPFQLSVDKPRTFDDLQSLVEQHLSSSIIQQALNENPENKATLIALCQLAYLSESLLDPIFGKTDAVGTVMRKKIQPVVQPLQRILGIILSP